MKITDSIKYVGVYDGDIDLFEGQYKVPGVSYNSYIVFDDKIAVMDTVDARKTNEWLANVEAALNGKAPDYLVIAHLEPDHSGSIQAMADKYPEMKLVMTAKALSMLPQFVDAALAARAVAVKENDTLALGAHTLQFITAPMVHWPEVMLSYERSEKVLFSADAFGTFGNPETDPWLPEARRYYFNIVGKYGAPVTALLKKAAALDIAAICPLHGPVMKEDLGKYLALYDAWSAYRPEAEGVFIAFTSVYGHTRAAAETLAKTLEQAGTPVRCMDLARSDLAEAVAQAFRYDRLVLASTSYNGGVYPRMRQFLDELAEHGFQNRRVGIVENGSWAPCAAKTILARLEGCKNLTFLEPTVTIRSALDGESREALNNLAEALK
jgi:flavorubredoxin